MNCWRVARLQRRTWSSQAENICSLTFSLLFCLRSSRSGSAARLPGGQEEAVHEGRSAGQAEKGHGAGQGPPPHRQALRPHNWGRPQRQDGGHQCGEQAGNWLLWLPWYSLRCWQSCCLVCRIIWKRAELDLCSLSLNVKRWEDTKNIPTKKSCSSLVWREKCHTESHGIGWHVTRRCRRRLVTKTKTSSWFITATCRCLRRPRNFTRNWPRSLKSSTRWNNRRDRITCLVSFYFVNIFTFLPK